MPKKKTVACSFLRKCVATSRVVLEKRKKKRTESVVHNTNQTHFLFKKWWDAQHGDGDEIEGVSILSFCVCVCAALFRDFVVRRHVETLSLNLEMRTTEDSVSPARFSSRRLETTSFSRLAYLVCI